LAKSKIKGLNEALKNVDMSLLLGDAHNVWMKALTNINKDIAAIESNANIEEQRKAFGLLGKNLSDVIDMLDVKATDGKAVYLEFCPMADDNNGSFWLSYEKEISNPFFGQNMLTCGEVKKTY
jgi:Cu(I)/Ag(I) efflux system membrane fusion protein